jgi:hypothetical protein
MTLSFSGWELTHTTTPSLINTRKEKQIADQRKKQERMGNESRKQEQQEREKNAESS